MSRSFLLADARAQPWLARLDPRVKLAWILAISWWAVLVDSPAALFGLFVLSILPAAGLRLGPRPALVIVTALAVAAWATALSQAIFYPSQDSPMLSILGVRLSRDGAIYGLEQSLRLLATMSAGLVVCLSTSPERLLAALSWLRLPGVLSFMVVTALRFLPLLVDEYAGVRKARRLRGYRFALWPPIRLRDALWLEVAILYPLLVGMLRRSTALAMSVTSRGFDPGAPRTAYPELRLSPIERVLLLALAVGCTIVAAIKFDAWLRQGGDWQTLI